MGSCATARRVASGDTARTASARVATLRLREAAIIFLSEDWFSIHPSFLGQAAYAYGFFGFFGGTGTLFARACSRGNRLRSGSPHAYFGSRSNCFSSFSTIIFFFSLDSLGN